ncbi:hypothetical protein FVE85_3891 [Porphyridium purpureum]|uniref:Uncharacterized protein n=1 Tax=Porphyridium purpureum TaxID=35688 RepID=A0A5J4YRJ7_PORPP|nr:hypothetical protein FVE85_3891 [Porphyridium purpureum]|eukprot:POR1864..scf229_5
MLCTCHTGDETQLLHWVLGPVLMFLHHLNESEYTKGFIVASVTMAGCRGLELSVPAERNVFMRMIRALTNHTTVKQATACLSGIMQVVRLCLSTDAFTAFESPGELLAELTMSWGIQASSHFLRNSLLLGGNSGEVARETLFDCAEHLCVRKYEFSEMCSLLCMMSAKSVVATLLTLWHRKVLELDRVCQAVERIAMTWPQSRSKRLFDLFRVEIGPHEMSRIVAREHYALSYAFVEGTGEATATPEARLFQTLN